MEALADIEMSWGDRLREEGRKEGREEGRKEGLLDGERKILLHMLTLMFGPLPDDIVQRIQTITDEKILKEVSQQLLQAKSLADLKIPIPSPTKKRRS